MSYLRRYGLVAAAGAVVIGAALMRLPGVQGASAVMLNPNHECAYCHQLHGAPGQTLLVNTVVETLCLTCHGAGGVSTLKAAVHRDSAASFSKTCLDCHTPHSNPTNYLSGTNLKLINATIQSLNVALESRGLGLSQPAPRSFADGDATYDGVCEVCHTTTKYHRSTSAGYHGHQQGGTCTACHRHERNFQAPTRSCDQCHNTAQSTRRAIIPELGYVSHHDSTLLQGALNVSDCVSCHDVTKHQQGKVRLWKADNPTDTSRSFVLDSLGDPRSSSAVAAKLTPFCLNCHDANGANGGTPFADGRTPPVIDSTLWAASSHNTSSRSCFGDGTFGCHDTGHGSQKRKLLAPAGSGPGINSVAEEEGFCFTCHDGSPASTNVQAEFSKGTNTSTGTYHHPVNDGEQSGGRTVECTDCHNPHQAATANKLKGVTGIDLRGVSVGPGTSNPRDVTEYEVCLRCHGDGYLPNRDINGDGYSDTSNKRRDFNDSASAYHPVQQAGRNQSGALQAALVGGLSTSSTIKCADCHNNEQTRNAQGAAANSAASPKGPHGSVLYPILRDTFDLRRDQTAGGARAGQFRLCFLCHDQTKLIGASAFAGGARTNFYGGSQDNLHWFHVTTYGGVTCRSCHYDAHGNQSASNTIYRITDGTTTDYASPPVGYKTRLVNFAPGVDLPRTGETKPVFLINVATRTRACALVCHGMDHTGAGDFAYNPQAKHGQAGQDNDPLKYVP